MTTVDIVERFMPVGDQVVALGGGRLLDVNPFGLDVLGQTSVG
jgi:hypothetical protein